jgi:TPR repeat protein
MLTIVLLLSLMTTPLMEATATPNTQSGRPSPVTDTDYTQALLLLQMQQFAQAAPLLQKAAERGVVEAQYQLGMFYAQGQGVPQDPSMALHWLTEAAPYSEEAAQQLAQLRYELRTQYTNDFYQTFPKAEAGDPVAMFKLGLMFHEGIGTQPNVEQAIHWLTQAAEANVADAQARLGVLYYTGELVEQDSQRAYYWLLQAAHLGEPASMALLGTMYRDAKGVSVDKIAAMKWFLLAAFHGNHHALLSLNRLIKGETTHGQQQSAQQAALQWMLEQRGVRISEEAAAAMMQGGQGTK